MPYSEKRGSILVAFLLILVLSFTTVTFLMMLGGGRGTLMSNQLKHPQAIYCCESALQITFNRVRGQFAPFDDDDLHGVVYTVNVPVPVPGNPTQTVPVRVEFFSTNTPATGPPYRVEAVVRYEHIEL